MNIRKWQCLAGLYTCRNFTKGGGKFGVCTKEGGGGEAYYYEVPHPILARGGENETRGGQMPPPPPLNTALPRHFQAVAIGGHHSENPVSKLMHVTSYIRTVYTYRLLHEVEVYLHTFRGTQGTFSVYNNDHFPCSAI